MNPVISQGKTSEHQPKETKRNTMEDIKNYSRTALGEWF